MQKHRGLLDRQSSDSVGSFESISASNTVNADTDDEYEEESGYVGYETDDSDDEESLIVVETGLKSSLLSTNPISVRNNDDFDMKRSANCTTSIIPRNKNPLIRVLYEHHRNEQQQERVTGDLNILQESK